MVDLILELIDFNEGVDYSVVSTVVIIYLILLWFFVSVWVFNDARYRFNNWIVALFLAILNLVLSFPFLLIYLLIRPSHRDDWDDFNEEGGVNIPLVNFTGEQGVAISLQLKIDSKKLVDEKVDYKLDVALTKDDDTVIPGRIEIVNGKEGQKIDEEKPNKLKLIFAKLGKPFKKIGTKIKSGFTGLKTRFKPGKEFIQNEDLDNPGSPEEPVTKEWFVDDNYKHNKKKNKSKKKRRR